VKKSRSGHSSSQYWVPTDKEGSAVDNHYIAVLVHRTSSSCELNQLPTIWLAPLQVSIYLALQDKQPPRDRDARGRRDAAASPGSCSVGLRGLQI
jgi:hypothetical protein